MKYFYLLFFQLLTVLTVFAEKHSTKTGDEIDTVKVKQTRKVDSDSLMHKPFEWFKADKYQRQQNVPVVKKYQMAEFRAFPELNTANTFNVPFNSNKAEFTESYVNQVIRTDRVNDSVVNSIERLLEEIERHGKFVDIISGTSLLEFPVGLKKDITQNSHITIGVIRAKLHPEYTEVDLFARVKLGELSAELFFGASGVKISNKGGIYEEARLTLLKDIPVGQNGGQWLLTFKGGMTSGGNANNATYITIDCHGNVKEMALAADVRIAKTVAIPVNDDGSYKYPGQITPGDGKSPIGNDSYVGAQVNIVTSSLEDLLIQVDLPKFEVVSFPGWGFKMKNALLDLSDTKNANNMLFPPIYQNQMLLPQGQEALWRGFYAEEVSITLPKEFKKIGAKERLTIGSKNLLIDNFGVSGHFFASNILALNEGDASRWEFSVDSLSVDLQVNHFMEAGFSGRIVLPVSSSKVSNGILGYKATIGADRHYSLLVRPGKDIDFNIFHARAKLYPESYVKLELENGNFYPEANLSGIMTIEKNGTGSDSGKPSGNIQLPEFKGLVFQDFKIQTKERPYIHIKYLGYKDTIALPKLAGFRLGFYNMEAKTKPDDRVILSFNSFLNLDESGIKGDVHLDVISKLVDGNYLKWHYEKTQANAIKIDVKRKAFELQGQLNFFKDDPIYGEGLAGGLDLSIESLNIELNARAIFGAKDDFRYWYVDAYGRPVSSKNKNFVIHDIGGGVYHHMIRAGYDSSLPAPSGIKYVPDKNVELGFKALAAFEVKKSSTFTGLAAVEMTFNSKLQGGGIRRIGFYGAASLMKGSVGKVTPFGTVGDMQKQLSQREQALKSFHDISLDKDGLKYFAQEVFPDVLTGQERFAAQLALDFDFQNKSYWGMMDVFLNLGKIKGAGEKNRLGYLEFYNSPDDWYVYVGTPTQRLGVKDIPVGMWKIGVNLYFMTGTILPPPARPPDNVIDILNLKGDELIFGRNFENNLSAGKGFAFGAEFWVGQSFDWGIIYASVKAGVGFDVMIRDFGNTQCKGHSGKVGMDGWYATGQIYAYLQGEIGAQIKIFGIRKRVRILKAGIAVLAQGEFPNPWFIKGYAGVKVSVLGLINIKTRLKVTIGEECEMIGKTGLQDIVIISDISPENGSEEVDVFDAVQVAFNVPIGETVNVEEEKDIKTYRVHLDEIVVKDSGSKIEGQLHWNTSKDLLTFESKDVLPPSKQLTAVVKVSFEEKSGGQWKKVMDEGKPVVEEKVAVFKTGKAPEKIPLRNIEYMYPIVNQNYMLPKEQRRGYIKLKKGQDYLFGGGYRDELSFITEGGKKEVVPFSYDNKDNVLIFNVPIFENRKNILCRLTTFKDETSAATSTRDTVYTNVGNDTEISTAQISGNAKNSASLVRLEYNFNTSQYNTFKEKMKAIKIKSYGTFIDAVHGDYASDVAGLSMTYEQMEPFDVNEVAGTSFSNNQPIIKGNGIPADTYFKKEIYPLIYEHYPLDGNIRVPREEQLLGTPPLKSIFPSNTYKTLSATSPNGAFLKTNFPFYWQLARSYKEDFIHLQYVLVNRYLNKTPINMEVFNKYKYIINGVFPYLNIEDYKVKFEYITPGMTSGTSVEVKYQNTF